MTARTAAAASLLALTLSACTSFYEVPIETPIQPKMDVSAFQRVLIAGFLAGAIPFTGIADIIARALDAHDPAPADTLDSVLAADRSAREIAGAALRNPC